MNMIGLQGLVGTYYNIKEFKLRNKKEKMLANDNKFTNLPKAWNISITLY